MNPSERGLDFIVSFDLDGTLFKGPPSIRSMVQCIKREVNIPSIGAPVGEYQSPTGMGLVLTFLSLLLHKQRPLRSDAKEGLQLLKKIAQAYQLELMYVVLSGRDRSKHAMTEQVLKKEGLHTTFSSLHLNEGKSSLRWKLATIAQLLKTHPESKVVHFEDDFRVGFCLDQLNHTLPNGPQVFTYVINNLSTHSWFLRRAGLSLPQTVTLVQTIPEAINDMVEKLVGNIPSNK